MKNWLQRAPQTMRDWLLMTLGTALIFGAVARLPSMAAGLLRFAGVLRPFAWGLVLAYVLDIPTRFFAQKLFGGRRSAGIVLSYLCLLGAAALLAALILPQLAQSLTTFFGRVTAYEETLQQLLAWVQETFHLHTDVLETLLRGLSLRLQRWYMALSAQAATAAAKAAAGLADAALTGCVALAASVYLLVGKETLLNAARACLRAALPPQAAGTVLSVCAVANHTFNGYIGGQLADALLVGGETFILMTVLGLHYAPLLSILVGVTNIIPVLGPYFGAAPGVAILLLESPMQALEFAIVITAVQQIDGNFIAPRILGGATGLPGLGVLLAIVAGGELFGIAGMLLGVPTLAVALQLLRQAVGAGLSSRGLSHPENFGGENRQI